MLTLAAAEGLYGTDSPEVARLCNQAGVVGKYTGDFDRAEGLYRRALAVFQHVYGAEHDSVATLYHNLGGLEHSRGRPQAGEPWSARSVEIRERLHGPDHPLVAADAAAWAPLLAGCGRLEEAETQLRRALGIFTAIGDEYEQAVTLHNLAALQQSRGAKREALAGYAGALAVKERALGTGHPDLAVTLVNLAALCRGNGEGHKARSYLERAIHILVPQVSADHPTLAAARRALESLS
ncbi:tetratricopeptide repeat protein [Streptomyces sp. NPDC056069]|uniref:tetratricopeptide repeat protein n=1 Tax=Streptomyces sp. NPDC056069 TaxID=3345702 RepID=UPI0035DDCB7B